MSIKIYSIGLKRIAYFPLVHITKKNPNFINLQRIVDTFENLLRTTKDVRQVRTMYVTLSPVHRVTSYFWSQIHFGKESNIKHEEKTGLRDHLIGFKLYAKSAGGHPYVTSSAVHLYIEEESVTPVLILDRQEQLKYLRLNKPTAVFSKPIESEHFCSDLEEELYAKGEPRYLKPWRIYNLNKIIKTKFRTTSTAHKLVVDKSKP